MGEQYIDQVTKDQRQKSRNNTIGKCPETTVLIGGNDHMTCLVDTGAEMSTVTESFFKEHLPGHDIFDTTVWMRIITMNGLEIGLEIP